VVITDIFKNRWRTLMSVDDVIADVIAEVDALGLSDSTYFFYTSDHGFQL
jgi:N-acetylglucosamine-6-sulfatase